MTDPTLPVEHGVEITLTCPADLFNMGGNKANCQKGQLVPTSTPPQCSDIGMLYVFLCDVYFIIKLLKFLLSCSEKLSSITLLYEQHKN